MANDDRTKTNAHNIAPTTRSRKPSQKSWFSHPNQSSRGPFRVKLWSRRTQPWGPLCPRERTSSGRPGMSEKWKVV